MSNIVAETGTTFSYSWSIPSLSINQKKILCFGYVRPLRRKNALIPQPVTDLCAQYLTPNDKFTLNELGNASQREFCLSSAFEMNNLMFAIGIYPNGLYSKTQDCILPILRRLSCNAKYSAISAYFTIETTAFLKKSKTKKARIKKHSVTHYCYDFMNNDEFTTGGKRVKGSMYNTNHIQTGRLKHCERLTMDLKFQFVDLDDINGKSCISKTQRKLNGLVKQNTILKTQNMELEQKLDEINEQSANSKKSVKIRDKRKAKELKDWLNDIVELPEYYKVFVENGIVDLFIVKLITMETLNDIKIQKIGHKLKIMHFVHQLNGNSYNNKNNKNNNKRGFREVINDDDNNNKAPQSKRQRLR